jgi:ABC-type transporter Mla subunit MlaD
LDRYTGAPTADEMARINDLAKQLRALIVDVNKLLEEEVPRLNKQINDAGLQISNPDKKIPPP